MSDLLACGILRMTLSDESDDKDFERTNDPWLVDHNRSSTHHLAGFESEIQVWVELYRTDETNGQCELVISSIVPVDDKTLCTGPYEGDSEEAKEKKTQKELARILLISCTVKACIMAEEKNYGCIDIYLDNQIKISGLGIGDKIRFILTKFEQYYSWMSAVTRTIIFQNRMVITSLPSKSKRSNKKGTVEKNIDLSKPYETSSGMKIYLSSLF